MATEIISKLKKRIKILLVVIVALVVLLATSSAYNIYLSTNTFESKTVAYYLVPDAIKIPYVPQLKKKAKKGIKNDYNPFYKTGVGLLPRIL